MRHGNQYNPYWCKIVSPRTHTVLQLCLPSMLSDRWILKTVRQIATRRGLTELSVSLRSPEIVSTGSFSFLFRWDLFFLVPHELALCFYYAVTLTLEVDAVPYMSYMYLLIWDKFWITHALLWCVWFLASSCHNSSRHSLGTLCWCLLHAAISACHTNATAS
jgi:hypothetical protein